MYRRETKGWFRHLDFILLDLICLQAAYVLAYAISGYGFFPYRITVYLNIAIFLELIDLAVITLFDTMKEVLKRGHYLNFLATVKNAAAVAALTVLYLFLLQQGQMFSRLTLILTFVLYTVITYGVRELWKWLLIKKKVPLEQRSLLIVATSDVANEVVNNIKEHYPHFLVAGVAIIDENWTGRSIADIPVVADAQNAAAYVCQEWIDEVLIAASETIPYPEKLIGQLSETGVTTHLNLTKIADTPGKKQFVERLGDYTVLTTSINCADTSQLVLKRLMDIAGGLVGCILTGIIFLFVAPAIYIASPGPIFFSQERVGRNGKKFKMYKFRSMYLDAEERKAELMKDNKLGDGKMFKLDFDPRVIGNQILPDGTHRTGIGDFIRRTSLDEFPQFFNVLKGDMSVVGTRPPLVSETSLYELHHYARLAIKPGITGMWQVNGRSDITDFEEVVRLDKTYIENWNIGLDIKILLKTVLVVFKRDGSA